MLTSGDVVDLDLGLPVAREAGFLRPAIVVTAQIILATDPNVAQVVPLTTTNRGFLSEVEVEPESRNGLQRSSVAQCQHIRSVSIERLNRVRGNIGSVVLDSIRETIGLLLDIRP